jgi:hypothetical protein
MAFLTLLICLLSTIASARNIVLLTSLPESQHASAVRTESIFRRGIRSLGDKHRTVVKHFADQEDLNRYLTDGQTLALFWVSHGGYVRSSTTTAVRPTPVLLDHRLDNVAPVFQLIDPRLKFLGVIGCNAADIVPRTGLATGAKTLSYFPSRKIIPEAAVWRAIRKFRKNYLWLISEPMVAPALPSKRIFTVTRKTNDGDGAYRSLRVFVGGILVGVLPKQAPGTEVSYPVSIPAAARATRRDLKVVFESGQGPLDGHDSFGELRLTLGSREPWRLFARADGTPFGTNERIFLFNEANPGVAYE